MVTREMAQLTRPEDYLAGGLDTRNYGDVKIYLTASSLTRAKRRYLELQEKGTVCDLDNIQKDIEERDQRDMNREISPLRQAEDAVLVDSSDLTIEQVVDRILEIFRARTEEEIGRASCRERV